LSIMGVAIMVLVFPFNLVMAPERNLQFVDKSGEPLANAKVSQTWYQYSLGVRGEIDIKTDSEGYVRLPTRIVRTSIISLLLGAGEKFKRLGIHASYHSDEHVGIFSNSNNVKWFWGGKGLESEKVIIDLDNRY